VVVGADENCMSICCEEERNVHAGRWRAFAFVLNDCRNLCIALDFNGVMWGFCAVLHGLHLCMDPGDVVLVSQL
jgi:hypothetical protein